MKRKDDNLDHHFYFGCPFCPEPKTTLEKGEHVFISVTTTEFGASCLVFMHCTVCGAIEEITDKIKRVSFAHLENSIEEQKMKPAITLKEAKNLTRGDKIYHRVFKDSSGNRETWQVDKKVKIYKNNPEKVKVSIKMKHRDGDISYNYLTEDNLDGYTFISNV